MKPMRLRYKARWATLILNICFLSEGSCPLLAMVLVRLLCHAPLVTDAHCLPLLATMVCIPTSNLISIQTRSISRHHRQLFSAGHQPACTACNLRVVDCMRLDLGACLLWTATSSGSKLNNCVAHGKRKLSSLGREHDGLTYSKGPVLFAEQKLGGLRQARAQCLASTSIDQRCDL